MVSHGKNVMGFDGSEVDGTKSRPRKMTFKELVTFRLNPLVTITKMSTYNALSRQNDTQAKAADLT